MLLAEQLQFHECMPLTIGSPDRGRGISLAHENLVRAAVVLDEFERIALQLRYEREMEALGLLVGHGQDAAHQVLRLDDDSEFALKMGHSGAPPVLRVSLTSDDGKQSIASIHRFIMRRAVTA